MHNAEKWPKVLWCSQCKGCLAIFQHYVCKDQLCCILIKNKDQHEEAINTSKLPVNVQN